VGNARCIVSKLIEGLDNPSAFDVQGHLESPVARLALTNGFVRDDRSEHEERYVKKLSNGQEAWLRTRPHTEFMPEPAMDPSDPLRHGGRHWEYLLVNPAKPSDYQVLASGNEQIMSYLLGALLQRLATWNPAVPKPRLKEASSPIIAKMKQIVDVWAQEDWDWVSDGCADVSYALWRIAQKLDWNCQLATGNAHMKDGDLFGHVWLIVDGKIFDPVAYANHYRVHRYEASSEDPLEIISNVYGAPVNDPDHDYTDEHIQQFGLSENVDDPDDPSAMLQRHIDAKTPQFPVYTALARFIRETDLYVNGRVTRYSSHYVHQHSTDFELEVLDGPPEHEDEIGKLADEAEDMIKEEIVDINNKIYRALEQEYDYLNSDEAVDEAIEANQYEFEEDGTREDGGGFQLAQLEDRAKERARNWYREASTGDSWWEYTLDEWKKELEDMGFDGVDINFSGFASQGDGASFTAKRFDFMKWAEYFLSDKPTERGHPYTDALFRTESVQEAFDPDDPEAVVTREVAARDKMEFTFKAAEHLWMFLFFNNFPYLGFRYATFQTAITQLTEDERLALWLVYERRLNMTAAKKSTGQTVKRAEDKLRHIIYTLSK
jgi:hypothetical protein